MPIITYIVANWVEWLFAAAIALLGFAYRHVSKQIKEERRKNDALMMGVQSLLRESIVSNYNKYQDRGYCPIFAKESIRRAYKAYHNLGGNDVATELYDKLLKMREEPEAE